MSLESPPPVESPSPRDLSQLRCTVLNLLIATKRVENHMASGQSDCPSDPSQPFRILFVSFRQTLGTLAQLRDEIRRVHTSVVPEVGGKAAQSYIEGLLIALTDRREWMLQFVCPSTAETANEQAEANALAVFEQLDRIRELWQFEPMDTEDLEERVWWELERLELQSPVPTAENESNDDTLVTTKDVASMVHLSPSGMTPYKKKWPSADICGSGRRPAKWKKSRLLPILKQQFSHEEFGDN